MQIVTPTKIFLAYLLTVSLFAGLYYQNDGGLLLTNIEKENSFRLTKQKILNDIKNEFIAYIKAGHDAHDDTIIIESSLPPPWLHENLAVGPQPGKGPGPKEKVSIFLNSFALTNIDTTDGVLLSLHFNALIRNAYYTVDTKIRFYLTSWDYSPIMGKTFLNQPIANFTVIAMEAVEGRNLLEFGNNRFLSLGELFGEPHSGRIQDSSNMPRLLISNDLSKQIVHFANLQEGYLSRDTTFDLSHTLRCLYFSFVTISTLGYGDISPVSDSMRCLVMIESHIGLILMGLFVVLLTDHNQQNRKHLNSLLLNALKISRK